jgi:pimeloyl-ACP methyl ester carboxylesterase
MHTILVPPLMCSSLVYGPILDVAWAHGSVTVADTRHDDTVVAMAARRLREAPEEFALLGTSMGGDVAIPGAELVTIADAGHAVFLEQPDASASVVAAFLDRIDPEW